MLMELYTVTRLEPSALKQQMSLLHLCAYSIL